MTQVNTFMKQKQTHRHGEQTCSCQGEREVGGKDWETVISRCKVLHTEWVSTKVLLYGTENYIQYFMINHNGKEYLKRMNVLTYV